MVDPCFFLPTLPRRTDIWAGTDWGAGTADQEARNLINFVNMTFQLQLDFPRHWCPTTRKYDLQNGHLVVRGSADSIYACTVGPRAPNGTNAARGGSLPFSRSHWLGLVHLSQCLLLAWTLSPKDSGWRGMHTGRVHGRDFVDCNKAWSHQYDFFRRCAGTRSRGESMGAPEDMGFQITISNSTTPMATAARGPGDRRLGVFIGSSVLIIEAAA